MIDLEKLSNFKYREREKCYRYDIHRENRIGKIDIALLVYPGDNGEHSVYLHCDEGSYWENSLYLGNITSNEKVEQLITLLS